MRFGHLKFPDDWPRNGEDRKITDHIRNSRDLIHVDNCRKAAGIIGFSCSPIVGYWLALEERCEEYRDEP